MIGVILVYRILKQRRIKEQYGVFYLQSQCRQDNLQEVFILTLCNTLRDLFISHVYNELY